MNLIFKKIVIFILLLTCCNLSFATFSKDGAGTSTAQFLKLGAGARASAMGDAFAGVADDATAVYWNPAGLGQIENKSISLMHAFWFEDMFYNWMSYVHPVENVGTFGIGVQYLSYGDIKETDETGLEGNDFKPNDLATTISYARKISDISVGINIKYISSKIKETAQAIAVDMGGMLTNKDDKLSFGIVVQNIGQKMKYDYVGETLPANIKLGSGYRIKDNWVIALDVNAPKDNSIKVGIGTEYNHKLDFRSNSMQYENGADISFRAGYSSVTKDIDGLKGITAGMGVNYKDYSVDYAFVPFGDLGNTHRISLSINFK